MTITIKGICLSCLRLNSISVEKPEPNQKFPCQCECGNTYNIVYRE